MKATATGRTEIFRSLPLIGALVFFAVLCLCDFPKPQYDDLFYTGAALNLASGGDFSNPLLARQGFPSHYFFVYPPIQSYTLAGWLKVFGIGAIQMLAFAAVMYWLISAATILILRRHGSSAWMEWAVPLVVAFTFLPIGLRPECPATALTLSGFVIATRWPGRMGTVFAGFLLLFLGMFCAPRIACFAAALAAWAVWIVWRNKNGKFAACKWHFGAIAAAFALTMLLFLWMIGFRVTEFLNDFHVHSSRVSGKGLMILLDYVKNTLGILQWPLVLLPAGLITFALWRSPSETRLMALVFGAAFVCAACFGMVGIGTLWWAIFVMLLLGGALVKLHPGRWSQVLQVAMALSLLVYGRKLMVNWYGLLSGGISITSADDAKLAAENHPTPEHPLLVDGTTARYVFNYHLAPGVLDLEFGTPFPGILPGGLSKSELRQGDIFMAGAPMTINLASRTYLDIKPPVWRFLGLSSFTYEKYPRQIYVFPSERCVDHRPTSEDNFWLPKGATRK